ncbi:MAG TPA: chloride channel protein [Acidimicrobiales bacterium]
MAMPSDPRAVLRSPDYVKLVVVAAVLGVPIAAGAWGFLWLIDESQEWLFATLPDDLGFDGAPTWWPLPLVALAGLLVGATIRYLPGGGGASPADGFEAGGPPPRPVELPGIFLAALAGLALGVVIGPEAPLIALGAGFAAGAARLANRTMPAPALAVVAGAGSFAAISALLGSPLIAAFVLMEAAGVGGPMLGPVLVPGLVAAGIGSLVFVGLDSWTGLGTFSLTMPDLPAAGTPTLAELGWAVAAGLAAAPLGLGIRRLALAMRPPVERRPLLLTPLAGLAVAALAVGFAEASGESSALVLFSGQTALSPLLADSASLSVGSLLLLLAAKGLAYSASLASFRGGPIFPALFLGAAGGITLARLPGLDPVAGAAIGMAAMSVVMLGLPLTSALLATLLLAADGLDVMPLAIVAVAVAYVAAERLRPPAAEEPPPAAAGPSAATAPSAAAAPAGAAAQAGRPGPRRR